MNLLRSLIRTRPLKFEHQIHQPFGKGPGSIVMQSIEPLVMLSDTASGSMQLLARLCTATWLSSIEMNTMNTIECSVWLSALGNFKLGCTIRAQCHSTLSDRKYGAVFALPFFERRHETSWS